MNAKNLSYLITPLQTIVNTLGLPLESGHIKVYTAGTTTESTTYSDFAGTENPKDIELKHGCATIIVDASKTFDLVVYDCFSNIVK